MTRSRGSWEREGSWGRREKEEEEEEEETYLDIITLCVSFYVWV